MFCCNISVCQSNKPIHQVWTIIGKKKTWRCLHQGGAGGLCAADFHHGPSNNNKNPAWQTADSGAPFPTDSFSPTIIKSFHSTARLCATDKQHKGLQVYSVQSII